MGHHAHELPNKGWRLWTRGGTEGVYIASDETPREEIAIPSKILRMLVADDIMRKMISELEQMETDEILGLL